MRLGIVIPWLFKPAASRIWLSYPLTVAGLCRILTGLPIQIAKNLTPYQILSGRQAVKDFFPESARE